MEAKSVGRSLLFGGIASCLAESVTMPVDVIKTRLQMQGADGTKQFKGLLDAFVTTAKREGPAALWKGVKPAMLRQATYGSLRYGMYVPLRDLIGIAPNVDKSQIPLYKKFLAGGGAGAISSFIANPTDLIKVRMQVDGMKAGDTARYRGLGDAFVSIVRKEGVTGLWKGAGPTMGRATMLAAVEMSSYDEIKQQLIKAGLMVPGTLSGVFVSSFASGLLCALSTSPFDVVKSRVMGQQIVDGKPTLYTGMLDCFVKTVRNEGPLALWKGFLPTWGRLGPRGVICWVTMEALNNWTSDI